MTDKRESRGIVGVPHRRYSDSARREAIGRTVVLVPIVIWLIMLFWDGEPQRAKDVLPHALLRVMLPLSLIWLLVDLVERITGHREGWCTPSRWGRIFSRPVEERNQLKAEARRDADKDGENR